MPSKMNFTFTGNSWCAKMKVKVKLDLIEVFNICFSSKKSAGKKTEKNKEIFKK